MNLSVQSVELFAHLFFINFLIFCLFGKNIQQPQVAVAAVEARDINLGESDFQCPPGYVTYPDTQCNRYYTCYGGQPTYLWQCNGDLLFDLVYYGCNWKEQVDCGDRVPPGQGEVSSCSVCKSVEIVELFIFVASLSNSVTSTTQTPTGNFTCPEADGFFALYPDYCDPNYIQCLNGVSYPVVITLILFELVFESFNLPKF